MKAAFTSRNQANLAKASLVTLPVARHAKDTGSPERAPRANLRDVADSSDVLPSRFDPKDEVVVNTSDDTFAAVVEQVVGTLVKVNKLAKTILHGCTQLISPAVIAGRVPLAAGHSFFVYRNTHDGSAAPVNSRR